MTGENMTPDSANQQYPSPKGKFRNPFRKGATGGGSSSGQLFGRCGFIGIVTILLLIPLGFTKNVVFDRMYLYRDATENIASSWGKSQTVAGPAIVIPYEIWQDVKQIVKVKTPDGEVPREVTRREYHTRHKVVLPSDLLFETGIDPEVRYRGIYKLTLYTAPLAVSGAFTLPTEKDFGPNLHRVHWKSASMSLGITDLKAIAETEPAVWNGVTAASYKPGSDAGGLLGHGFHFELPLADTDAGAARPFSLRMKIRGSGSLQFTPVGEQTTITMKGNWPSPSFMGNLLPEERSISEQNFSAVWRIPNLTRTYPQMGDLEGEAFSKANLTRFTAGVSLHEPVTLYRMVQRSVDYGILFIAVTFIAILAFEMAFRERLHLLQYAMVGLSMTLFYLVLLSLAEHASFGLAYLSASVVTVAMNSLYLATALASRFKGAVMGVLLAVLYVVLFILLRLEDYSLLMGTGLLLSLMGTLMYLTRKLPTAPARSEQV